MNHKQKQFIDNYLKENEMAFSNEDTWGDVKCIHSSEIEMLYKKLKELE